MVRLIPATGSSAGKHFLGQISLTSLLYGPKTGHLGVTNTLCFFSEDLSHSQGYNHIRPNIASFSAYSYPLYGHDPRFRSPADIAFAVALFIARKKGSFVSYYMVQPTTKL